MGKAAGISALGTLLLAGGMMLLSACSSGSGTPVAPTGFGSSKAIYQDMATIDDVSGPVPIALAPVYVEGAPGLDSPAGNEVFTDEFGNFSVYLEPATAGTVTYLVEVRDPTSTEDPAPVLWSRLVTVGTEDNGEPDPVEETSNGIGKCVSMCTKLYNPSSSVSRDLLRDDVMISNGNGNGFNAKGCQAFCKDGYRGSFPGDEECNPFYLTWTGSSCSDLVVEEPADEPLEEEPPADEPPADEPPPDGGGEE